MDKNGSTEVLSDDVSNLSREEVQGQVDGYACGGNGTVCVGSTSVNKTQIEGNIV